MSIAISALLGMLLADYLHRNAEGSLIKRATNAASRLNLTAINGELRGMHSEWQATGFLSREQKEYMYALQCRKIYLLKESKEKANPTAE